MSGRAVLLVAALTAAVTTAVPSPVASRDAVPPAGPGDAAILAGAASRTITPIVDGTAAPVTLAGFGEGRLASGVRDDLFVRVLVLEAGGAPAVSVALDLYGIGLDDARHIREEIRARTPEAGRGGILVACTRTHAAPDATGEFTAAGAAVDSAWLGRLARAASEAVDEAWRARQPARLSFAETRLPRALVDARLPRRIDDRALLLRVESAEGRVGIAALAVFGGSPETLGRSERQVSSDYPGALRRALENAFGGVGLFLLGASGGHVLPAPAETQASLGDSLARALVVAWSGRRDAVDPSSPDATRATLAFRSRSVEVPVDNAALREALLAGRRHGRLTGAGGLATEVAVLSVTAGGVPILDLACVPGEVFPELVVGGVQEPQDPASDLPGEPAEPSLRSLLRAPMRIVAGACGDDLGDIVPASEWDQRAPFAYGLQSAPRGEETSPGPRTAPILMRAFRDLLR